VANRWESHKRWHFKDLPINLLFLPVDMQISMPSMHRLFLYTYFYADALPDVDLVVAGQDDCSPSPSAR
jgi:hypothetical protein